MYPFNKVQQEDQSWRLELDGISIVTEGFFINDDQHWLRNPKKAIAFFSIDGNLYGLSNVVNSCLTAEKFYDVMYRQYVYFNRETFSDRFFREHGFILTDNNWTLEMTDNLGLHGSLEYRDRDGWYYNDMLLKCQPHNIGDLMHFYTGKTGETLKRIS